MKRTVLKLSIILFFFVSQVSLAQGLGGGIGGGGEGGNLNDLAPREGLHSALDAAKALVEFGSAWSKLSTPINNRNEEKEAIERFVQSFTQEKRIPKIRQFGIFKTNKIHWSKLDKTAKKSVAIQQVSDDQYLKVYKTLTLSQDPISVSKNAVTDVNNQSIWVSRNYFFAEHWTDALLTYGNFDASNHLEFEMKLAQMTLMLHEFFVATFIESSGKYSLSLDFRIAMRACFRLDECRKVIPLGKKYLGNDSSD